MWLKGFPGGVMVKNRLPMQETQDKEVWSLGQEDPLEKEMGTHSSMLAWKVLDKERGGLQSTESQKSQTLLSTRCG